MTINLIVFGVADFHFSSMLTRYRKLSHLGLYSRSTLFSQDVMLNVLSQGDRGVLVIYLTSCFKRFKFQYVSCQIAGKQLILLLLLVYD